MASLQAQHVLSLTSTSLSYRPRFRASVHVPINRSKTSTIPKLPALISVKDLLPTEQSTTKDSTLSQTHRSHKDEALISKLYAITEAVADRAEKHAIVGQQRNDWNSLLLNSINSISLAATLMAAISSIPIAPSAHLNHSSTILFAAATGMMLLVNKLQPSQLAEEQRKATQLFKQLERSIQTTIALGSPTELDVAETMEKVLAIDKAYPLPLLPLLEKFPKKVEPAVWWPKLQPRSQRTKRSMNNGWSNELEEEMMGVLRVMKMKDEEQYLEVGELVLKISKALAISGPVLSGLATVGAAMINPSQAHGSWPVLFAVIGGSLATIVNTLEHGGQMGMVFELFRNCAGYYKHLEEEIENNLNESEWENREDGELFRMKMALQLGRSLSELKGLAPYAYPSCPDEDVEGFAGKLF
ncbi:uncharacterized protein A4U43_C06F9990 [Asparagus officinalis]|uniref:F-box protein n=1 Tax=Asparagus officinalis TaxID=4686 RepID=A0A5P1EKS7_ASPOF|nr:probable F-box protein At4g22030 [Asparagus officinalis]ONK66595.1 uncharacterized protein A4U43_C06F9990 [Asparagus officinalis]